MVSYSSSKVKSHTDVLVHTVQLATSNLPEIIFKMPLLTLFEPHKDRSGLQNLQINIDTTVR